MYRCIYIFLKLKKRENSNLSLPYISFSRSLGSQASMHLPLSRSAISLTVSPLSYCLTSCHIHRLLPLPLPLSPSFLMPTTKQQRDRKHLYVERERDPRPFICAFHYFFRRISIAVFRATSETQSGSYTKQLTPSFRFPFSLTPLSLDQSLACSIFFLVSLSFALKSMDY